MKKITLITVLTIIINIVMGVSVYARNMIFCDIDFEDAVTPFAGLAVYHKENFFTIGGNDSNHYAIIKKTNDNDCHMDYSIGISVNNFITEADFSFSEISSDINPFYFVGVSADGTMRCDLDKIYVKSDMGLYVAGEKCYTFEKGKLYKISVALKIEERLIQIYVDGTKLAESAITQDNFRTLNGVRTWVRNNAGNTSFTMDNYRIYESDVPLKELPDVWESVFPDDGKQRISAEKIREIFMSEEQAYPRLFAHEEDFEKIKMSSDMAYWYRKMRQFADLILTRPVVKYELTDGYRLLSVSREVLNRMQAWGFMYQMTGDDKYYTRAMDDLEAICNFKDWHTEHFLDTAEMMTAAAIGYDWFYERMTDSQKEMLSEAIIKKGLEPTKQAYYGRLTTGGVAGPSMNFVMADTNMNIVDNCGAIIAAVAVFEKNPELCSDIIEKAIRSLDYSLNDFAPDGAWEEGINYWTYSTEYLTRAMCALDMTFGSDFGISSYEGLKNTARWAISLDSYKGVNSYHDTWDGMHIDTFALSGLGREYSDNAVLNYRKNTIMQMDYMPTVYDILWCNPKEYSEPLENENYTRNVESVSIRESMFNADGTINTTGLFFSTHGGRNDAYHSHLDAGAFVFDIDGERWAMDIPPEEYNNMIGIDNNYYYRKRAEGHNTVVINPSQSGGQISNASSWVCDHFFSENDAYAVYDMSEIYSDSVSAYKRGFYVGDNRRSLTVRDEMTLNKASDVYWFMHTKADIEPNENGAVLTMNGKKLKVEISSNCQFQVSKMAAEPFPTSPNPANQTPNTGINKLAIKLSDSGNMIIEVKIYPYDEDVSELMDSPVSAWKSLAKKSSERTVYDFEDYTGATPEGFRELNRDDISVLNPFDNAFETEGRSLWIGQKKTTAGGAHAWYQLRAEVNPVEKRYQHIHFEQAYDNQFSDRWLSLKFNDSVETSIPLFSFTRKPEDMSPLFKVNSMSYGIQPVSLMKWNSYDIVVDLSEKTYDMYVNDVQMANNAELKLNKDIALSALYELQFGFNHQWDNSQNAYAATNTYMDNITVKPLNEKPYFKKDVVMCFRMGAACEPRYSDKVVFTPQSGTAIIAKYNVQANTLIDVEMTDGKELIMEVSDGDTVSLFNWDSMGTLNSLSEPLKFIIDY